MPGLALGLGKEFYNESKTPSPDTKKPVPQPASLAERHSSVIAPAGHHCNVRSGHLNAIFGGKDMGSMAQTVDSSWSLLMP